MTDQFDESNRHDSSGANLAAETMAGGPMQALGTPASSVVGDVQPGPTWLTAIGWMLVFLIGQMIFVVLTAVGLSLALLIVGTPQQELSATISRWAPAMSTLGSLLTALLIVGIKFRADAPRALGLRCPGSAQSVLVVLLVAPLLVCASAVGSVVERLLPPLHDIQAEVVQQLASGTWLSVVIAGCLFPAVGEELFFRGFLGRGLVARYGVVGGVLVTSFFFGVFHLTPPQIAGTFVIGVLLHAVYLATKSLPTAMLLHFLINSLGLSLTRLSAVRQGDHVGGGEIVDGFSPLVVMAAALTLGLLSVALYRLRTRWVLTDGSQGQIPNATAETPAFSAVAVYDPVGTHAGLLGITLLAWTGFAIALVLSGALDR